MLDEVDILFGDEDFEVALQSLINSSPVDTQYLFVTATLPKNVYTMHNNEIQASVTCSKLVLGVSWSSCWRQIFNL